jgi:hypothetical protein
MASPESRDSLANLWMSRRAPPNCCIFETQGGARGQQRQARRGWPFLGGPWSRQPDRIIPVPIQIRAERRNINGSFYELAGVNPRG